MIYLNSKMNSMHTLSSHTDHHDPTTMQLQHQQQPQQQMESQQELVDQPGAMTVLESINQAQQMGDQQQQVISSLMTDPQQQASLGPSIHMVQQHAEEPHLHPMQPSHNSASTDSISSGQMATENEQQKQFVQQQQRSQSITGGGSTRSSSAGLRLRSQIDGLDNGGPIVQWLLENYEIADGESLPRSTVYNHYLARCRQTQLAPVNAASFGKLIRSVFIGLKTRRLGTRGHSKYHYFGVRVKQHLHAELLDHHELGAGCSHGLANNENSSHNTENGSESDSTGNECGRLSSTSSSSKRVKRTLTSGTSNGSGHRAAHARNNQMSYHHQQQQQQQQHDEHQVVGGQHHQESIETVYYSNGTNVHSATLEASSVSKTDDHNNSMIRTDQTSNCELTDLRNHLGANWSTLVDEHWPQRESFQLERLLIKETGSHELADQLQIFEAKYKSYYKRMVELLSELKFLDVEQLWREFWHPVQQNHWPLHIQLTNNNGSQNGQQEPIREIASNHQLIDDFQQRQQLDQHRQLMFHQLYQLTSQALVIERINEIDYKLYEAIESFLLPDMLSPVPRPLAQNIRQFAKNIGSWIELAVKDYDSRFAVEKAKSARAFGAALRRYTSLNHLSTAARFIWEKRSALDQMSMDLSRVDLRDIEHQVSLMSRSNFANISENHSTNLDLLHARTAGHTTTTDFLQPNQPQSTATKHKQIPGSVNEINNQTGSDSNNEDSLIDHSQNQHNHHGHSHHLCAMQPGQLIQNFLHLLEDPYPANTWPDWCRNLVESRVCGLSIEEARNFVLKWNFYISLIMKELTLRSAPSFGSFQLIRLLFDEYIFYLVVSRLAQAQRKTPAQLLSL